MHFISCLRLKSTLSVGGRVFGRSADSATAIFSINECFNAKSDLNSKISAGGRGNNFGGDNIVATEYEGEDEHSRKISKSKNSYAEIGKTYELDAISALNGDAYGFNLRHCGGRGDGGVDFRGMWDFPNPAVHAIGQCKSSLARIGPSVIREFEGVLQNACQEDVATIGIICGRSSMTRDAQSRFLDSKCSMVFVNYVDKEIMSFLMNHTARANHQDVQVITTLHPPASRHLIRSSRAIGKAVRTVTIQRRCDVQNV